MPAGYGTFQRNADTSAADRAVAGVKINASSSDDLVHTGKPSCAPISIG